MTHINRFLLAFALVAAGLGAAAAQGSGADPAAVPAVPTAAPTPPDAVPVAAPPPAAPAAVPAAPVDPNAPAYNSTMRKQCSDEIEKDAGWRADISKRFEYAAHKKAADAILRNERHVFIAYAIIWILVAGFVAMMWLRQGRLNAEIKRLEEELRRAERDDPPPAKPAAKPDQKGGGG